MPSRLLKKNRKAVAPRTPARPDARVQRSKELILRTTFDLLVERGMGGLSVDEVSRRSGVAKTTLYRHWKTRDDLVFEACALVSSSQEPADSGDLEADLTTPLLGLMRQLQKASWPLVVPSIADASERDAPLAEAFAQRQRSHAAPYLEALRRAQARGELSGKADLRALAARLVGPLYYRRWFTREPLRERFVRELVRAVVADCSR